MGKYTEILEAIKNGESINEKVQLSNYFLSVLEKIKDDLYPDERADITDLAYEELKTLPELIENAENYKQKCSLFDYENALLGFITLATAYVGELPQEKLDLVKTVVDIVKRESFLENAVDDLFEKEEITAADMQDLINTVSDISDTYQRGMLYNGLLEYKDRIEKMSDEAWKMMADYISSELDSYLSRGKELNEDEIGALEVACDVSKYFINDSIAAKLSKAMKLGYGNVNYYALSTLVESKYDVSAEAVDAIAHDLEYACLAYSKLEEYGKDDLFPAECSDPIYLAKSDMVHWLTYPTELGKQPDEIEFLGQVKAKKELYFIFRFKSDSDTIGEELKNEWLIGWSSKDGGTFSNFDLYEDYEKRTVEKTVKHIKRKLIG